MSNVIWVDVLSADELPTDDVIVQTPAGLKFASRECIYDSEMIPNSIIYPI